KRRERWVGGRSFSQACSFAFPWPLPRTCADSRAPAEKSATVTRSENSMASVRSTRGVIGASILLGFLLFCCCVTSSEAHGSPDANGNITIKWDVMQWTPDGYVAVVTIYNFQRHRNIGAPGWRLGWKWAKNEVIWSNIGARTTEQGDCSRFRGNIPSSCKKDPTIVDQPQNTPYNMQIANCCKGGVLDSWGSAESAASFQIAVGWAGNTNKTVRVPMNFTLKAPAARNNLPLLLDS
ncbi:hypothetical protein Taro_001414, partial [Colocasia esculenta]|nr:hypothetical protein [Colocasia esculenta]